MSGAETWRALLALPLIALVGWLPGYALCRTLVPGIGRVVALAAAPALSAGLLYCLGEALTSAGFAVDERLAGLVVALGVLGLALDVRGRGWGRLPGGLASSAVVIAVAWAAAVWALGVQHLTAVAPHDDGYNHGMFVKRVVETRTLDPTSVMPHDVLLGGHGVDYYPLALHQQAAVLVRVLHLDVAVAWNLTALSLVVVALPIGMLAVGRRLFPRQPRVAAACALLSALAPGLTYSTSWWGGYTLAAGMAAAPGALLLLLAASRARRVATVSAAAIALAGLAGLHTSELSLVLVVAGVVLLVESLRAKQLGELVAACVGWLAVTVLAMALLAPAVLQLKRGLDERADWVPTKGQALGSAVREVVVQLSFVPPMTPTALVLALWAGLLTCLVTRRALPWVAAWALFAVLYVWLAAYPSDLVAALTSTWYSDRFRLGYILAFLAIPLMAHAVAGGGTGLRRELRLAGPVLGVVIAVTSTVASVQAVRQNYRDFSLVGPDERAAFSFLSSRVGPGEHVLNQHQDGSPWMYALADVAPVVALKAFDFERPEWRDATYLARNVHNAGSDPEVDRLLGHFNVRYVYVGPRVFTTARPDLDRELLAGSGALHPVFRSGSTVVYEVDRS